LDSVPEQIRVLRILILEETWKKYHRWLLNHHRWYWI